MYANSPKLRCRGRLSGRDAGAGSQDAMQGQALRTLAVVVCCCAAHLRLESGGVDSCGMQKAGGRPPMKLRADRGGTGIFVSGGLPGGGKMPRVA